MKRQVCYLLAVLFLLILLMPILSVAVSADKDQQAQKLEQYTEAIDTYKKQLGVATDPTKIKELKGLLCDCYFTIGEFANAQPLAAELVDKDLTNKSKWLGQLGVCNRQLNKYTEAIDSFKQALEIATDSTEVNLLKRSLFDCYYVIADWKNAQPLATELVNSGDPNTKTLWLKKLGYCNRFLGQYDEAIDMYKEGLEKASDPNDIKQLKGSLFDIYFIVADWKNAQPLAVELVNNADSNEQVWWLNKLGYCDRFLERYDEAIDAYKKGLEVATDPNDINKLRGSLFDIYYIVADWTNALPLAVELVNNDDPNTKVWWLRKLGVCYRSLERYTEAIDSYNKGLKIATRPEDIKDIKIKLTECYFIVGDFNTVITNAESLIKDYPQETASLLTMIGISKQAQAEMALTSGDLVQSHTKYKEAIEILNNAALSSTSGPDEAKANALYHVAEILLEQSKYE